MHRGARRTQSARQGIAPNQGSDPTVRGVVPEVESTL